MDRVTERWGRWGWLFVLAYFIAVPFALAAFAYWMDRN